MTAASADRPDGRFDAEQVRRLLESPAETAAALTGVHLDDPRRACRNLVGIVSQGVPLDLMADLLSALRPALAACPDADMALNNLERLFAASRSPLSRAAFFVRDTLALGHLVLLLSTSQYFADILSTSPDLVDWLVSLPPTTAPVPRHVLRDELFGQVNALVDPARQVAVLRRFRKRQLLRIGYNDIVHNQPFQTVVADISRLAEVSIQAALEIAWRPAVRAHGRPMTRRGPAAMAVIAVGKLGGEELNYSSDIDLIFVHTGPGQTEGPRPIGNQEFFDRLAAELLAVLSAPSAEGQGYRVDMRLRPGGRAGVLVPDLEQALAYYESVGRTWERQALVKARPVAGDPDLGAAFLAGVTSFVYRKYLTFEEINEIKELKRQIQRRAARAHPDRVDVKTGRGGIRDIEFVVQFLQLFTGGRFPEVRTPNTLEALARLEAARCLQHAESQALADAYVFLRTVEHRLQTLFDLQTHTLPQTERDLRKLASRLGWSDRPGASALDQFRREYDAQTASNRRILDRLLLEAFEEEEGQTHPEVNLILDPDPDPAWRQEVLRTYRFRDVAAAYQNLERLAAESVPFLSSVRCRSSLANIAPALLRALADTPDPDMALVNLERCTASLGAKGVLYELFAASPATLRLYVELCAGSQFLSEILVSNPGMIDPLMDSLVRSRSKTGDQMRQELTALCRGAVDIGPILYSYNSEELLRIGVRDLLHKDTPLATMAALTDLAEAVLDQVVHQVYRQVSATLGQPQAAGRPCPFVVLGLGKFGGRELTYRSDLDLVFVYEADGETTRGRTNLEFFTELGQGIIRLAGQPTAYGRLYEIDPRLRPTGRSGSLAAPLEEFRKYYLEGAGRLWERQALTKARPVAGDPALAQQVGRLVDAIVCRDDWRPAMAAEIRSMRRRLEQASREPAKDVKRGFGGVVDIEFIAQLMQIKHGASHPAIRHPNTATVLEALAREGLLADEEYRVLADAYLFLRRVESRLRIVHNVNRSELPAAEPDLERLARRLSYLDTVGRTAGQTFLADVESHTHRVRQVFNAVFDREERG